MPTDRTADGSIVRLDCRRTRESAHSIAPRRRGSYTSAMRGLQPVGLRRPWKKPARLVLFAEATAYLLAAWAALRWFPFKKVVAAASRPPAAKRKCADIGELRRAVDRSARLVPWRAMCIERGIALQAMARRRGIASLLHYGIKRDENGLNAHVWLSVDGHIVIGGETAADFVCAATFPADSQQPIGHPAPSADLR